MTTHQSKGLAQNFAGDGWSVIRLVRVPSNDIDYISFYFLVPKTAYFIKEGLYCFVPGNGLLYLGGLLLLWAVHLRIRLNGLHMIMQIYATLTNRTRNLGFDK